MTEFDPLDTGGTRNLPPVGASVEHPEDMSPFSLFGNPTREGRLIRRRRKIAEEIGRNRRGEYKVPTWALVLILVVFIGAWALWIALA
jgi:hypothetical protein